MRYYMNVLNLTGYEVCMLRDLVVNHSRGDIIKAIDSIIDNAVNVERVICDSRLRGQYDFSSGNIITHGNRSCVHNG